MSTTETVRSPRTGDNARPTQTQRVLAWLQASYRLQQGTAS